MAIFFSSVETSFQLSAKNIYKNWIKRIIQEGGKKSGDLNFIFCSDEYLLDINQKFLKHFYYTDVITFNDNSGDKISGDIFISIDRVKENAVNFAKSFDDELRRVCIHGVLHLLGYKDKTAKEQRVMRNKEDECLLKFGKA